MVGRSRLLPTPDSDSLLPISRAVPSAHTQSCFPNTTWDEAGDETGISKYYP